MTQETPTAYFASLTIENVKCFKDKQTIDLSNGNDKPALWTVILGNNNTGKTTLLKCLADLEPKPKPKPKYIDSFTIEVDPYDLRFYQEGSNINCKWFINNKNSVRSCDSGGISMMDEGIARMSVYTCCSKENNEHINTSIYGYGTNRRAGKIYLSGKDQQDTTETLFDDGAALNNIEEWLLQLYVAKELRKNRAKNAEKILTKIVLFQNLVPHEPFTHKVQVVLFLGLIFGLTLVLTL